MKNPRHHISDQLMPRLSEFVTAWLGLHFPRKRWRDLHRNVEYAAQELGIQDLNSFAELLVTRQLTKEQEEILASHLTIGETYFFREQNSFDILESHILPDLIASQRGRERRLRIWSAGCSSGEEPYSLAILLSRLIPDLKEWQVTILASDINTRALAKAAQGMYGEWSFRGMPQWLRRKFFTQNRNGLFELTPAIRRMVSLAIINLAEDSYPSLANNTAAMDIILCRNVMMYFEKKKQLRVIDGFSRALVDGGWLLVSPCETSAAFTAGFETVMFPGAVFYGKRSHEEKSRTTSFDRQHNQTLPESQPTLEQPWATAPAPALELVSSNPPTRSSSPPLTEEAPPYDEALTLYRQGSYGKAVDKLSPLALSTENDPLRASLFEKVAFLMARSLANQGKTDSALVWIEKAIAIDKLNAELYYLRATIFQEQGDLSRAIASLKQSLYLDHGFVLAHFTLGILTQQMGTTEGAKKHFENALSLLRTLPADEPLPGSEGMTTARLTEMINACRIRA